MTGPAPGQLLASKNWSQLIKQLDTAIQAAEGDSRAQLLINRGFCLQQLGLFRKALKDYEEVLSTQAGHPAALLNKSKVHVALKQLEDARECLAALSQSATGLAADLAVLLEGQQLAAALDAGEVKEGAKLPLLPAVVPPAPAPAAAKPKPAFASGFLAAPPKPAPKPIQDAACQTAGGPEPAAGASPQQQGAAGSTATDAGRAAVASSARGQVPGGKGLDAMDMLVARTNADQGVSLAINLVNQGSCQQAVDLLNLLLQHHPGNAGALATRGTALALLNRLEDAVKDFSAGIAAQPHFTDLYVRRAQALAALGEAERSAADFMHALELSPDPAAKAHIHEELGNLHSKGKDYRRAAKQLQIAASLAPGGPSVEMLCALGLCQVSQGDLQEGITTLEAALKRAPEKQDLWLNLGMACKEICWVDRAEQALRKAASLAVKGAVAVHAYRLLAQMRQGLGDHLGAVLDLNRGIAAAEHEKQRIELRFLRGACHHAVGLHKEAVDDYQQTMEAQDRIDAAAHPDLVPFMCLAFYQKEMALYVRKNLDRHVLSFCVDADLHPEFKELWCKKGPPSAEFVSMYRGIAQPQQPNWSAPRPPPPPSKQLAALLTAADAVGKLVQYDHQGFLPNKRQQRMAGLAAIELAQTLQQLAADRRAGRPTLVDNAGASVSARKGESAAGKHAFGWRDAMDGVVRWRQLAEPNDQVIWVDLLTERQFSEGFGSHTPMFTGQTKCVRYYMAFHRALAVMKRVLAEEGRATDADNNHVLLDTEERQAAAAAAQTAEEMWQALGTDSWVVVPIDSTSRPGHKLEGTRLTMVCLTKQKPEDGEVAQEGDGAMQLRLKNGVHAKAALTPAKQRPQPDAYEFSIRTPVTPARWDDYDEELSAQFEALVAALAAADLAAVADSALRFAYYWYNFMPLARGSALCGYVSLLAAFLAAGAPVRAAMPKDYQTDWEAILESQPERFIASVSAWMLPPEVAAAASKSSSGGAAEPAATVPAGASSAPLASEPAGPAAASGGAAGDDASPSSSPAAATEAASCSSSSGGSTASPAPAPCPPVEQLPKVIELLPTMRARLEALNGEGCRRI